MTRLFMLAATCVCLCGCISIVSVKKATPTSEGVRYYLPEVFIKVTPKSDGTVAVDKLYLADPSQEYVISAVSLFGNYTMDINRSDAGLLELVTFETDTTGIAKQLATSVGNVRAAEIDAQAAKAKADAAAAKDAADKAKAALAAADQARKDAATVVDIAQRKLDLLQQTAKEPTHPADIQDQIFAARLALLEAQARRDAADAAYAALLAASADSPSSPNAGRAAKARLAANARSEIAPARPTYPGPMFYRIRMDEKAAYLEEAFPQQMLVTWQPPRLDFAVLPSTVVVRPESGTGALSATVKANYEVSRVELEDFVRADGKPMARKPIVALQADRVSLKIDLPKETPQGKYELDARFTIGTSRLSRTETASVTIVVDK